MSGIWRGNDNHDIGMDNATFAYPQDYIAGVYYGPVGNVWFLRFESGWQIGTFDTVDEAIEYALRMYREHIRMV